MLWVFSKKFQEQFSFQAIMTSKSNKRIKQYSLNMIQPFLNFSIKDLFSKYEQLRKKSFFFYYLGFLSRTFTIHRTAGEGESYSYNSSLPLPFASQALRHYPGDYCRELTSGHNLRPDSNREPLVFRAQVANH